MTSEMRRQTIQEIAYSKWEQAGWPAGDGFEFWLDAEREFNRQQPSETHCDLDPSQHECEMDLTPCAPPLLKKLAKAAGATRKRAG